MLYIICQPPKHPFQTSLGVIPGVPLSTRRNEVSREGSSWRIEAGQLFSLSPTGSEVAENHLAVRPMGPDQGMFPSYSLQDRQPITVRIRLWLEYSGQQNPSFGRM
jgi:hypothetical protein